MEIENGQLVDLALAVGLGLLVGLQREWKSSSIAGIRTFPLLTSLGFLCTLLSDRMGGIVMAAGIVAVTALLVMANYLKTRTPGPADPGMTTEAAAIAMFAVGAALAAGMRPAGLIIGGVVLVLLHGKDALHRFVGRVGQSDLKAVAQLALIALVVLPALPNRAMGPYDVLNPYKIWLMVVLIVGISLAAYVAARILGSRTGSLAAGFLGGLISSTATTMSYAKRTKDSPAIATTAALVIILASATVFIRVLIELAVVAPKNFGEMVVPLLLVMALMSLLGLGLVAVSHREAAPPTVDDEPPSDLKAAVIFGLLYAVVLLAVAAARDHFGNAGLYPVAALSGLTDMDAITLSTGQLVEKGDLDASTGWRMILLGGLSNLVFKGILAGAIGTRRLMAIVGIAFTITILGGLALLGWWPG